MLLLARLAVLVSMFVLAAPSQQAPDPVYANAINVLATVRDKHWDPQLGGLNWQAVHDELRPAVEDAASMEEAVAAAVALATTALKANYGRLTGN